MNLTMDVNLLLTNPFQMAEPYTKYSAYIDLFLLANSKHNRLYPNIKYDDTTLQLLISEKALAGRWQWSIGKIRRYFEECETLNLVNQLKGTNEKTILIYTQNATTSPDDTPNTAKVTAFTNYIYDHYPSVDKAILDDFVKYWTRLIHRVPRFELYLPFNYDEKIQYFINHRKIAPNTTTNEYSIKNNPLTWH